MSSAQSTPPFKTFAERFRKDDSYIALSYGAGNEDVLNTFIENLCKGDSGFGIPLNAIREQDLRPDTPADAHIWTFNIDDRRVHMTGVPTFADNLANPSNVSVYTGMTLALATASIGNPEYNMGAALFFPGIEPQSDVPELLDQAFGKNNITQIDPTKARDRAYAKNIVSQSLTRGDVKLPIESQIPPLVHISPDAVTIDAVSKTPIGEVLHNALVQSQKNNDTASVRDAIAALETPINIPQVDKPPSESAAVVGSPIRVMAVGSPPKPNHAAAGTFEAVEIASHALLIGGAACNMM